MADAEEPAQGPGSYLEEEEGSELTARLPVSLEPLCPLPAEEWLVKWEDSQGQMGSQEQSPVWRVEAAGFGEAEQL